MYQGIAPLCVRSSFFFFLSSLFYSSCNPSLSLRVLFSLLLLAFTRFCSVLLLHLYDQRERGQREREATESEAEEAKPSHSY